MKFRKGGSWLIDHSKGPSKKVIKFEDKKDLNTLPCIYLWVIESEDQSFNRKVLYVGKAGKGLKNRMKQHEGGFKGPKAGGSISGMNKKNILFELLKEKKHNIVVYFKEALRFEEYDHSKNFIKLQKGNSNDNNRFKNLTFFSFEEEYYIKYFGIKSNNYLPPLNGRINENNINVINEKIKISRKYF